MLIREGDEEPGDGMRSTGPAAPQRLTAAHLYHLWAVRRPAQLHSAAFGIVVRCLQPLNQLLWGLALARPHLPTTIEAACVWASRQGGSKIVNRCPEWGQQALIIAQTTPFP